MTLRNTLDTTDVRHRVDGTAATASATQSDRVRSLLAGTGANGSAEPPVQLLRDRYDRGSEAYLNGAICRIEYAHIVEQINQLMAALVAPDIRVTAGGGAMPAPRQGRTAPPRAKGRGGKGRPGTDAGSDAGFAEIVQHTHIRLAGRDRPAAESGPFPS